MTPPLSVLVLAGGEGRRLGGHKALRRVGGARLVDRPLTLARALSSHVLLLAGARRVAAPHGVRMVPDDPRLPGPLGGLAAGLEGARHPWCLVLPCDMPDFGPDLVARLTRAAAGAPLATEAVAYRVGGRLQPFGCLVHRRLLPRLRRQAGRGRHSLSWLLQEARSLTLDAAPSAGDDRAFLDVDEPADLARMHATVGSPPWAS